MEKIVSIDYDKHTSEFCITYHDPQTGISNWHANHLTEREKEFARSANFCEDDYAAHWTERRKDHEKKKENYCLGFHGRKEAG